MIIMEYKEREKKIKKEKWKIALAWIMKGLLILLIPYSIVVKNFALLFILLSCIFVTFLPTIIERRFNIDLPLYFTFIILIVVYFEVIGDVFGLFTYAKAHLMYDKVLHVLSTFLITMLTIMAILSLQYYNKIKLTPAFIFVLAIVIALAIGALYEIFEFITDAFFPTLKAQLSLEDTMFDMIANFFGGLIAGIFSYVYISKYMIKGLNKIEGYLVKLETEIKEHRKQK